MRGAVIELHNTETALQGPEIALRDSEKQLHGPETALQHSQIGLRRAEMPLRDTETVLHRPEIAVRGAETSTHGGKKLYFSHLRQDVRSDDLAGLPQSPFASASSIRFQTVATWADWRHVRSPERRNDRKLQIRPHPGQYRP
jgi:hypothetical protein